MVERKTEKIVKEEVVEKSTSASNEKKNIDIIDISKLLNISIKYLEIIIFQLERNKILGIKNIDEKIFVYLAKPAAEITVTDLITSFKDKYILNNIERNTEDWIITDNMIHNFVWERIWEKIKGYLLVGMRCWMMVCSFFVLFVLGIYKLDSIQVF